MEVKELEVLIFSVGGQNFGVDAADVIEVLRYKGTDIYPEKTDFSDTGIDFRDARIPIIDISRRLEMERAYSDEDRSIIVFNIEDSALSFDVDSVVEFVQVTVEDIESIPDFIKNRMKLDFIWSVGKIRGELVFFLDLGNVLNEKDIKKLPIWQ
ncbi:MAG: chemotaxis protein CheW [Elusimicrobiota bacterium]